MSTNSLVPEDVAAEARGDHGLRRGAGPESWNARRGGEIRCGVLEGMRHVVLGDFDREAYAILGELFDGRLHGPAHSASVAQSCGEKRRMIDAVVAAV